MYDGVYHTPLDRFSMLDASTVGIVSVPDKSALEASRRELSEDTSFGIGALLVVEQSSFGKPPQAGAIYSVVYRKVAPIGQFVPGVTELSQQIFQLRNYRAIASLEPQPLCFYNIFRYVLPSLSSG